MGLGLNWRGESMIMIEIITNPYVVMLLSIIGYFAGWHIGKWLALRGKK
jgi:hypothetical protein